MRRRERDVFELGQEQLLEEPAVELVEPEGPSVPPPAAGSPIEAEGPEEARAAKATRSRPRVPSLGRLRRHRGAFATAITGVGLGAVALVGARHALEPDAPIAGLAGGKPHRAERHSAAPSGPAERARPTRPSDAEPTEPAEQTAQPGATSETASVDPAPSASSEPLPAPSDQPTPSDVSPESASPSEPPADATPQVVAREFGL